MTALPSARQSVISWKAGLLALLVGVISFSSFIVLSAFAPDLEDKDMAGLHAFSKSALGYNFSVEMLQKTGRDVTISRSASVIKDKRGYGLLVLTPEGTRDINDLKEANFDRADPLLIVLPKHWGHAGVENRRHQSRIGEINLNSVSRILQPIDDALSMRRIADVKLVSTPEGRLPVTFEKHTQVISNGPIIPIISTKEGTVFGRVKERNIYILADPELLNTHGVAHIDNARLMLMIFDEMTGGNLEFPITFDTTINGFERARNLLRLLFEPPLLGATLFAFAAAALLGWAAFVRFGRDPTPKPKFATGRASLIDSTAGLFEQTNQEHLLAEEYADIVERLTVTELGYPDDLTRHQIEDILRSTAKAHQSKNRDISEKPKAGQINTAGQLVSFAKAYQKWKKDMSNERQ